MGATYTAYNLRIIAVLTLGSLTFGYAYSVISNTLGQPSFSAYFGLAGDDAYANAISGAVNGLFAAGGVFGAIHTGWMCESKGRKLTMNTAAAISIIGGAVQTGSVHIAMFLVGRFVNGWGIGMMVTLIPIYQAEICEFIILPFGLRDDFTVELTTAIASPTECARLAGRPTRYMDRYGLRYSRMGWRRRVLFPK